ncbi:RTA1 like protein-domain-containing protein [Stachybotrys elegans]|uniref:RTA1 like protein-domain-containing protein n=1 Tax=Stachybotrys elegans TaxID=80388 RepID=A0A8K0WPU9_9HYPO|nr:RTA1 like protein-domain-containing protein [Stachybotrys elegans]
MSNLTFEQWTHTPEAQEWCADNPDSSMCDTVETHYHYELTNEANLAFAIIFAISLICFLVVFAITRRAVAFTLCLSLGVICEVAGYVGRIMSYNNPWADGGFMLQMVALTIGPAFMAAGLYLCLRRIVTAYGQENSWIRARSYTLIFVPCDIISLILQAMGGAAAGAATTIEDMQRGADIMTAGLACQVATTVGFMIAVAFFIRRTRRRYSELGWDAYEQNPSLVAMRGRWTFHAFMYALALSTIMILWRSCFRLAELADGWGGPVMQREDLFIGFEGVLIVVAVLALNVFHPAVCLGEVFVLPPEPSSRGGIFGIFRRNRQPEEMKTETFDESA